MRFNNVKINIDQPQNTKETVFTTLTFDDIEFTKEKILELTEIMKLADGFLINNVDKNYTDLSFYVNDIYEEGKID